MVWVARLAAVISALTTVLLWGSSRSQLLMTCSAKKHERVIIYEARHLSSTRSSKWRLMQLQPHKYRIIRITEVCGANSRGHRNGGKLTVHDMVYIFVLCSLCFISCALNSILGFQFTFRIMFACSGVIIVTEFAFAHYKVQWADPAVSEPCLQAFLVFMAQSWQLAPACCLIIASCTCRSDCTIAVKGQHYITVLCLKS